MRFTVATGCPGGGAGVPNTPENRGTVFLAGWQERFIAEREAVVVTTTCGLCKTWRREGPMGENRDLLKAHRLEAHPDVKPVKRLRRVRPGGQVNTAKSLDDNIAAARAQGASTWAGDLDQ